MGETEKKKEADSAKIVQKPVVSDTPSSATQQKVVAAKQYIENHYKAQMKNLQERKERRWILLERKLADADLSQEEQMNILKNFEQKETEFMRRQRHKMGVDDFELLTIIGRGAFGEMSVSLFFVGWLLACCIYTCDSTTHQDKPFLVYKRRNRRARNRSATV